MSNMEKNQKTFNIYVFLSTFARALIETFIPLLLFKFGYSLKEVVLYFLLYNFIELVISYPMVKLATKKGNKILAIFGLIAFVVLQIMLNYMEYSIWYLLVISFLYAVYRAGYWLSRRYFNLKVIHKKDISSDYSIVTIVNQVALVFAGYIGSVPLMLVFTVLTSLGEGPWQGDFGAVIANCSEHTYLKTGKRIDGSMFSCTSFGTKLGGGIGVALSGWLLEMSGYVNNAATQPASCISMMNVMYLWLPFVFDLIVTIVLSFMNIEEANKKLKENK